MKLSGRNLQIDTRGDDVRLLHWELMLLHQSSPTENFPVAENEIGKSVFGPSTKKAVSALQWKLTGDEFGDGIVSEELAEQINAAVDQLPAFRIWVGVDDETSRNRPDGLPVLSIHDRGSDQDTLASAKTDTEGVAELTHGVNVLTSGNGWPSMLRVQEAQERSLGRTAQ